METKLFLPGMVFAYLYYIMALINVTINQYGNDADQLNLITQKLDTMNEQVDQLKADMQASNEKLDAITASQAAIRTDIQTLNDKIADLSDGATREQVAELAALGAALKAKAEGVAAEAADIDALTPPVDQPQS